MTSTAGRVFKILELSSIEWKYKFNNFGDFSFLYSYDKLLPETFKERRKAQF